MRLLRPGLVALLALVLLGSCTSEPDRDPPGPATGSPKAAEGWRTEYWREVAVEVPATWGWGSVPVGADRVVCGPGPSGAGYVGRPIATSDLCTSLPDEPPAAPYVWLGAEVGPGTVDLGDGWVQQTAEVAGETVTVAADDAALRERILSSARPAHGPCESSIERAPAGRFDWTTEGVGDLVSAELCVFRRGDRGLDLAYASAMTQAEVRRLLDAVLTAPGTSRGRCPDDDELLVVRSVFTDHFGRPGARLRQEVVVRPTCDVVDVGPAAPPVAHRRSALTDAVTQALAVGGSGAVSALLIGPLG